MPEETVKRTVRPLTQIAKEIRDPRFDQGKRYPLSACLLLVWAGLLCKQENLNLIAKWGKKLSSDFLKILGFKRGIAPGKSALYDLFNSLDPHEMEVRLGDWAESVCLELDLDYQPDQKKSLVGVAIDGKALRGSKKQGALFSHLLSAVVHQIGITLFQLPVSDKTNEIPIMEYLLRELFLEGRVVTMDALLAQRDIADQIIDLGGDYLMNVKLNQPTVHNQIKDLFNPDLDPQISALKVNHDDTNADQSEQLQLVRSQISPELANLDRFDEQIARIKALDAQQAGNTCQATDTDLATDAMELTVSADVADVTDQLDAMELTDAPLAAKADVADAADVADVTDQLDAMELTDAPLAAKADVADVTDQLDAMELTDAPLAAKADVADVTDQLGTLELTDTTDAVDGTNTRKATDTNDLLAALEMTDIPLAADAALRTDAQSDQSDQSACGKQSDEGEDEDQFGYASTIDYGHGRIDIRILRASDQLNDKLNWPHVGQVLTIRRIRINKATGEILSDQSHYYITSLTPEEASAADLLRLCRDHWTIENRCHYVRDVTFGEDASQVRKNGLPQIMAACRNTVISALRRLGVTSIKGSLSENSADPFGVFTYLAM